MAAKRKEDKRVKTALTVISILFIVAYLLLTLFEALSRPLMPKPVPCVFMGIAFLAQALTHTGKERIWDYALAAVWFIAAVLHCF